MDLLVGIPVYGQQQCTHDLIPDLHREGVDFLIIDNRGDYEPLGDERVLTPGRNTGWAHPALLSDHSGPAANYGPRDRSRELLAVDGAGLKPTRDAFIAIGGLDERSFLNHFGRKTADELVGGFRYQVTGGRAMGRGLRQLHGRRWRREVVTRRYDVRSLADHRVIRTEAITPRGGTQTVENSSRAAA